MMQTENLTEAQVFCGYHQVEYAFVQDLANAGLVEITIVNQTHYISQNQLPDLERMIRLHQDLNINVAGIEAITHLLRRLQRTQQEVQALRNKLRIYE
ncbi:chaperone modulator CbpM [Mucilaginibacter sp. Bleaf8]|uniref:chaperone modulator CbpM n=1 Tax=Mucilaginibacter sp. Bleaf8 TaxID=2834430 RepID=UPI001BCF710D|nr:chaperone modulator CbpM [Mucilaginibacter sp. Bleaf8]MBS7564461.1 chaperone modulator CbpM [Mucilaginibacter sp. Bleaf8]